MVDEKLVEGLKKAKENYDPEEADKLAESLPEIPEEGSVAVSIRDSDEEVTE